MLRTQYSGVSRSPPGVFKGVDLERSCAYVVAISRNRDSRHGAGAPCDLRGRRGHIPRATEIEQ